MKSTLSTILCAVLLAGCSLGTVDQQERASGDGTPPDEVVLVTHESFALPKALVRQFERESGLDLEIRGSGDAGALTTRLAVTQGDPIGDVAFGVDNTFASRALDEAVFETLGVDLPAGAEDYVLPGDDGDRLAPIDNGNVCVNIDTTWFEEHDLAPPRTLADLADPAYEGLLVTPSALSSSPGLAFLLATVAEFGDGWPAYWEDLLANDTRVVDGWTDAYYGDFTQGGEGGSRPIVVSYDSSPAFTVPEGSARSTTRALLETCFRQVEYAGVLAGAANPAGAREVVRWLLGEDVQAALPDSMYVYPVRDDVALPARWDRHAEQPEDPYTLPPEQVADHRDDWLEEWRDLVTG